MAGRTKREICDQDVQGLKCLRKIRPLLSRLRNVGTDEIKLAITGCSMDHYYALILMSLFSPAIQSLRNLQRAGNLRRNPSFQCPSDPNSISGANNSNSFGVMGAGGIPQKPDICKTATDRYFFTEGILFVDSKIRFRHITDGASKTSMLGETKYQLRPGGRGNNSHFGWASSTRSVEAGGEVTGVLVAARWQINSFAKDGSEADTAFGNRMPMSGTMGSFHVGGCHVAFADASVRFINDTINLQTHRYFGSRDDGYVTDGF